MGSSAFPALDIRPPQSPLETYAQAMGIREAQQNGQLRAQQIQGAQTQNAMNALALKSQQALVTAGQNTDWSQPDAFDKYMEKAEQGGANPQQLIQLRAQNTKYLSDLATLDKTKLANEQTKNDALLGALDGISSTDPAVRAGQAQFQARQILSRGLVDNPQLMPLVQKMAAGQFVPTDDQLSQFKNGLTYHSTQIKQALEQQQTKTSAAQQGEAEARAKASEASAEKTAFELQLEKQFGGFTGAMADARYRNIVMNEKLGRPVSQEESAWKAAYEKQKTLVPQFNFNMQAGGGGMPPLNPRQVAQANAILEGGMKPPSAFAQKTPYWQNVMGYVLQQDPHWTEQRAELRHSYTVGKQSDEINAINTAMAHIGVLGDAIDNLHNTNMVVWNRLANAVGVQVGKDPVTTYRAIVHRVAPELATAYGTGTEGERTKTESDFDPALGQQQLKSNVGITAGLIRGKIGSLENQWNQNKSDAMPSFEDRFIMPQAKAALDKYAPQRASQNAPAANAAPPAGATMKVPGSDGKLHWSDGKQDLGVVQ